MRMWSWRRAGLLILPVLWVLPALAAAEGLVGRVTFLGTLSDERMPDGSVQARFRFRVSESTCGTTEGIWTRRRTGSTWTAWEPLPPAPVPIMSDPAAVARGPSRIDVFARGSDNHLYWTSWDGAQWSGWTVVPGPETFTLGPAVASRGPNFLDVFARSAEASTLQRNIWNGTSWRGWGPMQTTAGTIASDPEVVARGPNRMDAFARLPGNKMGHSMWTGGTFTPWSAISNGVVISGAGGLGEWWQVVDRIEVFARGTNKALWTAVAIGGGPWSDWTPVGSGTIASDPATVSLQLNQTEVFARRDDDRIYTLVRTSSAASDWTALGDEQFSGSPAALAVAGRVHLFAHGRGRADRWIHARSGKIDGGSDHNAANFRNAYNTLLSAFLARTVSLVQVDGLPGCDPAQTQTIDLPGAIIGILP